MGYVGKLIEPSRYNVRIDIFHLKIELFPIGVPHCLLDRKSVV